MEMASSTNKQLKDIFHKEEEHPPLVFKKKASDKESGGTKYCGACWDLLSGETYSCEQCNLHLHKHCAEAPLEIYHPVHRKHPLLLSHLSNDDGYKSCQICERTYNNNNRYSCSSCDIWIHAGCLVGPISPVIEDKKHHEHPFNLLWRQHQFICYACGTEGKSLSYVCVSCHLQVHQKCISLPHFIKHTSHPHPLSHRYFDVKSFSDNKDCRMCYEDVKTEHGSYSCLKEDCDYIVHVNCAIEDAYLYNEIDEEEARELIEKGEISSESCITCIIKKDEFGEAVMIKHSFHEHPLFFREKSGEDEDDDKQCDGCIQSIFTSFYYCQQCNFFLHKSCANLPEIIYDWTTPSPFTLKFDKLFRCFSCSRCCSGFYYNGDDGSMCIPCGAISYTFEHPGHQHFLFFDGNYEGRCSACDEKIDRAHRCKYCKYGLNFPCMTLPHKAKHKFDRHVLDLSYHDEEKYQAKNYCDICEEERDPKLWFYHCSSCDNSAHPNCVLRKYSQIKSGSIYRDEDIHPHPLTFVRKVHLYPECDKCDDPCADLSLECVECNFIVHYKCIRQL